MIELIKEMYPQLPKRVKKELVEIAEAQAKLEEKAEILEFTTVHMTINILAKLHELNPELSFVATKSDKFKTIAAKVTPSQINELAVVIGSENATSEIENLLMETVALEITKEIKETEATRLFTTSLVESVMTIQEANFEPKLAVKLRYHLK